MRKAGAVILLATAATVAQPARAQQAPARRPVQAGTAAAGAPTDSRYRLDTISHGIKLTLIMPRRAYPLDSLTQVTVRVENMSGHAVVANSDNICNVPNPRVESITGAGAGAVLYPPPVRPFSDLRAPPCPPLTGGGSSPGGSRTRIQPLLPGLTLAPGAIAEGQVYVVVRSRFLRVSAVFNGSSPATFSRRDDPLP